MNWNEYKLEITIVALTGFAIFGLMGLGGKIHLRSGFSSDINYEMPRPKSTNYSEFSLEGREITRSSVAAQAKAKDLTTHTKAEAAKKKEKKKETKVADKASQKKTEVKRPQFSVNVVQNDQESGSFTLASSSPRARSNQTNRTSVNSVKTNKDEAEQQHVLSEAEWRALILSQPTRENFQNLVQATQGGQVSEAFAYGLMEEMYKTHNSTTQENIAGAVSTVSSPAAFSFAVRMSHESQGGSEQTLSTYVNSYGQKQKFAVLNQVLSSSQDLETTVKALDLISTALNQNTVEVYDGRGGRGASLQIQDFAVFRSSLQSLAHSNSSEVVSIASDILSHLNSNSTAQASSLATQEN